jgi:FixJ family two-component response regulator
VVEEISMSDMEYDIQELFIEGYTAQEIAQQLDLSEFTVCEVLASFGVSVEYFSPYATVNS